MGSMAEVCIPAEEFALHETLSTVPTAQFEVERVVAHENDRVLPFVWTTADDHEMVKETLENDSSVENMLLLSDNDDAWLYRMEWVERVKLVTHILLEHEGVIFEAVGSNDEWHLRIFFPERDSLSQAHEFAQKQDLTMDIRRIYEVNEGAYDRYGLSEEQHETLVSAFDRGYYNVPHGVTTEELGEEFGITAQAVSKRLHRGHGNLVKETLIIGSEAGSEK
ncbi:bacterio-opsin activator domain-containing protein [Haladaptatus halobius]|uniref:bacterio-opsin activator domain-containing protein n=1 Tax=Haladaptatus halobius TaxID=2884875 RepID=UPI001D0A42AA|nr:bacterio-opsin activator domain-containing protein [Haladaptatus halobius]